MLKIIRNRFIIKLIHGNFEECWRIKVGKFELDRQKLFLKIYFFFLLLADTTSHRDVCIVHDSMLLHVTFAQYQRYRFLFCLRTFSLNDTYDVHCNNTSNASLLRFSTSFECETLFFFFCTSSIISYNTFFLYFFRITFSSLTCRIIIITICTTRCSSYHTYYCTPGELSCGGRNYRQHKCRVLG